jgi:tetratricopeptide (TPR) repeat protein
MADPWLDELLNDCYDVYRLRVAGGAAVTSGDARGGLPWLERAVQLAPDNAAVHRQLGDAYAVLRDFPRAREQFDRAATLAPGDDTIYQHMIDACNAAGDSEGAARALAAGLTHCPQSAPLQFAHGKQRMSSGHLDEALQAFEAARNAQPEAAEAYLQIATIHFRGGRDAAGVAVLEDALAHVPDHGPTLLALAQHAIESNDAEAAAHWLTRARTRASNEVGLEILVGDFQRRFGRIP